MGRINVKLEQKENLMELAKEIIGDTHKLLTLEDKMLGSKSKKQERKVFTTMDALRNMLDESICYQTNKSMKKVCFDFEGVKHLVAYKAKGKIGVMYFYDSCIQEVTYESFSDFMCFLALGYGVNEKYVNEQGQIKNIKEEE